MRIDKLRVARTMPDGNVQPFQVRQQLFLLVYLVDDFLRPPDDLLEIGTWLSTPQN